MAFGPSMEIDEDSIDDAVLGLLWLTLHDGRRAWKGFDWAALARLHEKGMILDPVGKAKSVVLTDEGLRRSEALFRAHCACGEGVSVWSTAASVRRPLAEASSGPDQSRVPAGRFKGEGPRGDGQRS